MQSYDKTPLTLENLFAKGYEITIENEIICYKYMGLDNKSGGTGHSYEYREGYNNAQGKEYGLCFSTSDLCRQWKKEGRKRYGHK